MFYKKVLIAKLKIKVFYKDNFQTKVKSQTKEQKIIV